MADDPETLRIKQNTKQISNVAYHGDLEKKAAMERQRETGEITESRGELIYWATQIPTRVGYRTLMFVFGFYSFHTCEFLFPSTCSHHHHEHHPRPKRTTASHQHQPPQSPMDLSAIYLIIVMCHHLHCACVRVICAYIAIPRLIVHPPTPPNRRCHRHEFINWMM